MTSSPYHRDLFNQRANFNALPSPRPEWQKPARLTPPRQRPVSARLLAEPGQPPQRYTAPPRRIKRPYSRFLIDTKFPSPCRTSPDVRAFRSTPPNTTIEFPRIYAGLEPRHLARLLSKIEFSHILPPPISDPDFVFFNGIQSRKRRADETEVELFASLHDHKISPARPVRVPRQGISAENVDIVPHIGEVSSLQHLLHIP